MNQSFAKLTFFAGLALAGANSAQAQSPNPVDSHIGDVNTSIINLMNNPLGPKGPSSATVPLTGDTQLHVENGELAVGTTIMLNDSATLRFSAATDKVLGAAGWVFHNKGTEQVIGFVGGSRTIKNMIGTDPNNSSYNTGVPSYSAFAEIRALTGSSNAPIFPNAITIGASVHTAGKKLLHSSSVASQTSKQHTNSTHVVEIGPDNTTYTDTETTTTVTNDWLTTYNTLYSGGSVLQARLSADWNIGQNGVATIALAQDTKNIPGESEQKHTSWDAQYKHSFDNSSTLIRVNNNGRVDLEFNTLINNMSLGLGVFTKTRGGSRDNGAKLTISYPLGIGDTQPSSSKSSQGTTSSGTKILGDNMNIIGTWTSKQAKGSNTFGIVTTKVVSNNIGQTTNVTNKVQTSTVEHRVIPNNIQFVTQERIAVEGDYVYVDYNTESLGSVNFFVSDNDIASVDSYGVVTIKMNKLDYFNPFRTVIVTLYQEKWTNPDARVIIGEGVATYTIHILCNPDTNSKCFLSSIGKN